MKKKLPKYQFAGQNPCGPGTVWDATQKICVPTQQVDPVFDNALWGNPDAQNQHIINPNAITPPIMNTIGDRTSFNEQARQVNGKVIPSDVQAIFRGYNNEILPDINAGTKDKAGNWIPDKNVIGDAIDKGFNYDSDGVYRKKQISVDKNNLGYSAGFKALNVGLDAARLIGNNINDFKNTENEEDKLLAARYKKAKYNNYETGLNNVPAYAQDGGEIDDDGGGKKRRKQGKNLPEQYNVYSGIIDRNGKEILHPTEFQAIQNMTDYLKHNWSDQATEPSNVYRAQFQHLAINENQMMQPQQPIAKYGVDLMATGGDLSIVDYLDEKGQDFDFNSRKKIANNIGIDNYTGTAEQNMHMLAYLKSADNGNQKPTNKVFTPKPTNNSSLMVGSQAYNDAWQQYATKGTSPRPMDVSSLGQNSYAFMNQPNQANAQTQKEKQLESGIVIDKRTGKAYQIKGGQITKEYPAITGENVNADRLALDDNPYGKGYRKTEKITPTGYFNITTPETNTTPDFQVKEFNGNIRSLEPIAANGIPAPPNNNIALHETYHPWERDKLYNSDHPYASYGCVNCRPQDAMELIKQNQGDTMRIVDSQNFKDKQYLESYKPKYAMGGDTSKNDKAIAAAALNGGTINGSKLTAKQKKHFNYVLEGRIPLSGHVKDAKKAGTYAEGGEVDVKMLLDNEDLDQMQNGGIEEVDQTNMEPNAELEQGEVFQQQSGDIQKVAENEPTHEEGGSMQADVHRVLEDTSDKRKDKMSKALRVTPAEAELIVGFKPKSTTSHSKLYELAHKKNEAELKRTETLIGKNLDFIKYNNGGKYAQNSAEENLKILQTAKRKEDIFNDIFDHQENIKQQEAMLTEQKQMQYGGVPKYAVGGTNAPIYDVDPYTGAKTVRGSTTPTGKNNAYNKDKNYLNRWETVIPGVSKLNNKEAQAAIYSYTLKNNPDAIKQMWTENGNTTQGRNNHNFDQFTTNGIFNAGVLDDKNMLGDLSNAYVDGMFGRRQLEPPAPVAATPQKSYGFTGPVDDNNPAPVVTPAVVAPAKASLPIYTQPKPITPSELHSPLGLSGGLGNVLGYIGASGRTPVDLEQLDRTPLRVHEVNPLPTLLENQGAFNAAIEQLPNNGVGFANTANLTGQKYKVNNQVLGQYENTNKQKYDQVDQYNDQAQYQLDGTNLQLRDQFVNRVLTGEEKQRLQKQEYANSFFKAVDERNAFDANGNLALKLSPYFNAKGEFNGNDYNIAAKYAAETGNTFKYDTDAGGNVFRTMYDKTGKIVPNSRIITDKGASKKGI